MSKFVYFFGGKIGKLQKYEESIAIGSAIAAIQTLVQTYLPRYGWIVSDIEQPKKALPAAPAVAMLPDETEPESPMPTLRVVSCSCFIE